MRESLILRKERDDPLLRDSTQKCLKLVFSKQIPNTESVREEKEEGKLGEFNGGAEENFMEIDSGTDFSLIEGIEKEPHETKVLGTIPKTYQASVRKWKVRARQIRPHFKSDLQSLLKVKRPLDDE
ncbi:hypothetical protein U1Q18_028142 [Sarracenia purpurea var. burkii]